MSAVLLLYFCRSVHSAQWKTESIQHIEPSQKIDTLPVHLGRSVVLSVAHASICALDRIVIHWKSSLTCSTDLLAIAIVRAGGTDASTISLAETTISSATEQINDEPSTELIRCDINSNHCIPKVSSISAQPENLKLVLHFDGNTTQPTLPDGMAISNALLISPILQLDGSFANWTEANKLEVQLSQEDMNVILTAHGAGELIEAVPRIHSRRAQEGSVAVRPTEPGDYEVVVVDVSADNTVLSDREVRPLHIHVALCDDATVLPKLPPSQPRVSIRNSKGKAGGQQPLGAFSLAPKRTVQVQGPVAVTGQDPLVFAHSSVDPKVQHGSRSSISYYFSLNFYF